MLVMALFLNGNVLILIVIEWVPQHLWPQYRQIRVTSVQSVHVSETAETSCEDVMESVVVSDESGVVSEESSGMELH